MKSAKSGNSRGFRPDGPVTNIQDYIPDDIPSSDYIAPLLTVSLSSRPTSISSRYFEVSTWSKSSVTITLFWLQKKVQLHMSMQKVML
jgi:hypothetical protein